MKLQNLRSVLQSREQPLRVALTGGSASPDIAETLQMIGKDRSLSRIGKAIEYVQARSLKSDKDQS